MFVEKSNRENKHQAPESENTESNIVKLPWIPIIGPTIRKELQKTGCKIIYTSDIKNMCSLDQLNTKKIAWQENGKHQVQLNNPNIVMRSLIGCTQKRL